MTKLYTIRVNPDTWIPTQRYFYHEQYKVWVELIYKVFDTEEQAEQFIDKHIKEMDWEDMSVNFSLSEKYVQKYFKYLSVHPLCHFYSLSENFMREYKDELDWANISQYHRNLSLNFIKEMKNYFFIEFLKCNWYLKEEVIENIFK